MKNFIFRFPTSKKSKWVGGMLKDVSEQTALTADKFFKNQDGTYTKTGEDMLKTSKHLAEKAAHKFGFRNLADMEEYIKRHGKI